MSKGSIQRKGTGYAEGWDRIFGKMQTPPIDLERMNNALASERFELPSGLSEEEIRLQILSKVNDVDLPITMECQEIEMVCGNCRNWIKVQGLQPEYGTCQNDEVLSRINVGEDFQPNADFGCTLFEERKE